MTGHDTHGHRPGRPDPDREGDAALDAVLTVTTDRLLATLEAALDIDAGLAAVRAADPATAEPLTADRPEPEPEHAELQAVCQELAGYLADLDPAADSRARTSKELGSSVLYLGAVHRLLEELQYGLLTRALDRDGADRLARLIEHNAAEASHLLGGERRRASRRARAQLDGRAEVIAGIRGGMPALRHRIRRLFDDAGHAAPHDPAPRLPV
jgi:hypothetical protein